MILVYGQTEVTGCGHLSLYDDPSNGHVGGPADTLEFKLEDVPDMEYYAYNP